MKKIFLIIISITILTGCSLGNTPTSRVEELLSKYQRLDKNINIYIEDIINDSNLEEDIINKYEQIIKKQYRNLSYEIKEEEIDGNKAEVTVEIEVMNYKKIIDKYNKNNYDKEKYHKLVTKALTSAKDKITYTIEIPLILDNEEWKIEDLNKEIKSKLLGIY